MVDKHAIVAQLTGVVKGLTHRERTFKKTRNEKITDLNRVKPGDHVSFYKTDFYYAHHGIVYKIYPNSLVMIHYFNTLEHARTALTKGSVYIAAIIESEWKINLKSTVEDVYLHHYDGIPCFSNEETLERALSQLGRRGYSLIGNNCEHWSRWCRTDEHYSEQIYKFRGLIKEKSATLLIIDPTALLVKEMALVSVRTFGQFLSALGSGVILTAVEGISAFIDIKKKRNERTQGTLSDVALKKYVVRRITSASTTVIGGTAGTVVGTVLIPVPILGATVGGIVGSVGGKLIGDVTGIALSKILEVYEKIKASKIKKMSTVAQLINNLTLETQLVVGLIKISSDSEEEEERISDVIQEAITSKPSSLYPSLEQFMSDNANTTPERCQAVTRLTVEVFPDSNSFDYFVLTAVPDENAAEEFAASTDLLVLRWPLGKMKPWESEGEQVLNIEDFNSNKEG